MSEIRLFGSRISPFVEKVARALSYKGIMYDPVPFRSPLDARRWNPQTGKMPVLEIEGERVWDSTFILRRLDQHQPEPRLYAADARVAAAQRTLEDWSDESLYWLVFAARWAEPNAAATSDQLASLAPSMLRPVVRQIVPRQLPGLARAQGAGRLPYDVLLAEYGRHLDDLVLLLGEDEFFHGSALSAADLAIQGELNTAGSGPTPDLEGLLSHRPALVAWKKRVEQRTGG